MVSFEDFIVNLNFSRATLASTACVTLLAEVTHNMRVTNPLVQKVG